MIEETGNPDYQFIAVRLPYGIQKDMDDVNDAIELFSQTRALTLILKQQ